LKKARKRAEKGAAAGGFTVHFFLPFFRSLFRWISFSFPVGKFVFSLFNTFYISELKRGKNLVKNGGNHKKPEKWGEKGQEKGNCERP
jgi:hypothetical protein